MYGVMLANISEILPRIKNSNLKIKKDGGAPLAWISKSGAGIFKKSMGARHRGGIGFSYRPAKLHRLAEFIPWNQFRDPINI
jgi:hypothetical protein